MAQHERAADEMNGNGYNGRTPGSLGDSFERFEVVSTTTTVGRKVGVCCCDEHVYSFVIRDLVLNKQWNVGPKTTQDFHQLHYRLSNLQVSGDLPNDVPVPALPSNGVYCHHHSGTSSMTCLCPGGGRPMHRRHSAAWASVALRRGLVNTNVCARRC